MEDQTDSPAAPVRNAHRKGRAAPRLLLAAAISVVVAVGFVVWLLVWGTGGSTTNARGGTIPKTHKSAAAVSEQGLTTLARVFGTRIYWAGPRSGVKYELTQTTDGRYFVRYLPKGAQVGSNTPYLFVATSPLKNAFAATTGVANRSDSVKVRVPGGGVAFYSRSSPKSVYIAYRGSNYQIEVFDPNPQRARQLVRSDQVRPIR